MNKKYAVYILASKMNGTLYIGVTGTITARIQQHQLGEGSAFTKKYSVHQLVHCEFFDDIKYALYREKQLKAWKRKWKLALIEENNPEWNDLSETLI